MSPRLLRSLSVACKSVALALEREADELEQRIESRHDYRTLSRLPAEALTAASAAVRHAADRGGVEQCSKCGALRTSSKPWRFWSPGAKAWSSRKPACGVRS